MTRPTLAVVAHSSYGRDRALQLLPPADGGVLGPFDGLSDLADAMRRLVHTRPRVVYAVDVGTSTTVLGPSARTIGARLVVDTGDVAFELARSLGRTGARLAAVWAGEKCLLAAANHVVVRGTAHLELVQKPATFVPDVAPPEARSSPRDAARAALGIPSEVFVAGLVGSLNYAKALDTVYGWDLIEALALVPDNVHGLVVGDGDGRTRLEARVRDLGIEDRVRFTGRVPPNEVARTIAAMDVGVSTQTNDLVGAVRTTGKVPLYLACGVPVVASDVGEAKRLFAPLGWTVPYHGVVDRGYPARLAEKLSEFASSPELAKARRRAALGLSHREYDPDAMRERLRLVVERVAAG